MNDQGEKQLEAVRELYERSLDQHGTSSMGVGWRDDVSHRLRFDALTRLIEGVGPFRISDLGCGYGAFYKYLEERSVAVSTFRGLDISQRMLDEAAKRHPQGEWVLGSSLNVETDYAFACGIFNVRLKESEDAWLVFIEKTLDNMHAHAIKGFAFNLLSTYVDFREPNLFYGDPCYFFDLCKRCYSRKVALFHEYPLYEWTIIVRK